jgi:hypothetical protein
MLYIREDDIMQIFLLNRYIINFILDIYDKIWMSKYYDNIFLLHRIVVN